MVTVDDEKRGSSDLYRESHRKSRLHPTSRGGPIMQRGASEIGIKRKRNKSAKYNSLLLERKMKLSLSAHDGRIFPQIARFF